MTPNEKTRKAFAALRAIAMQHDSPCHPGKLAPTLVAMAREGMGLDPKGTDIPPLDDLLAEPVTPPCSLEKAIVGALRSCIVAHGPITPDWIGSAAKRVAGVVRAHASHSETLLARITDNLYESRSEASLIDRISTILSTPDPNKR